MFQAVIVFLLPLFCLAVKNSCSCTYSGYAGTKCGNNPSVSVALPTVSEGQCTQITGFDEGYFDFEGLSWAGIDITSSICNGTTSSSNSSGSTSSSTSNATATTTNTTNSTNTTTSTNSSSTTNSSVVYCPGSSVAVVIQSFVIESCQGNQASFTFYAGTTCSGSGYTIDLVKGKCSALLEVNANTWASYQLKCNRGGGSGSGSGALRSGTASLAVVLLPLLVAGLAL